MALAVPLALKKRQMGYCWRSPTFVRFARYCVKSLAVNDELRGFSAASALKAVSWDPVP